VDPCRGGTTASGRGTRRAQNCYLRSGGRTSYRTFDAPYGVLEPLLAAEGRLDEVTCPNVLGMITLLYRELSSAINRISNPFVLP
jgi:hypothetical protein